MFVCCLRTREWLGSLPGQRTHGTHSESDGAPSKRHPALVSLSPRSSCLEFSLCLGVLIRVLSEHYPFGLVLACGASFTVICFQDPADDEAARLCRGIQETTEPACTDVHDDAARAPIQGENTIVDAKKLFLKCVHVCLWEQRGMHAHVTAAIRGHVHKSVLSTMGVLGTKLRVAGLVACTLPHKPSCQLWWCAVTPVLGKQRHPSQFSPTGSSRPVRHLSERR